MPFRQVDVSDKPVSSREATATGKIVLKPETVELIRRGRVRKGDPMSLASLTGVLGAKLTPRVVALSHQLDLQSVTVDPSLAKDGLVVTATVKAEERTGVEMEALVAVSVALLNVWDVVKQYEKDAEGQYPSTTIQGIRVTRKVKRRV